MDCCYAIQQISSTDSIHIQLEYELDDVFDTHLVESEQGVDDKWLNEFRYIPKGRTLQHCITNDLGWYILSSTVINLLTSSCRNVQDLNLIKFTERIVDQLPFLKGYYILGVKRTCPCLDFEKTDAQWSKIKRMALVMYNGCLKAECIPSDVDIFRIAEWPICPVVRSGIAEKLMAAKATGLEFRKFPLP